MKKEYIQKNIRVPGHDIKVSIAELLLINTSTFQRLNYIKQLGLAHLVYPFALHTRASHCIDSLHMAQEFIAHLDTNIENSTIIKDEKLRQKILQRLRADIECIRAAAILHDIMHIPYAHTLEDENGVLPKGDKGKRINIMVNRLEKEFSEFVNPEFPRNLTNYRVFSFPNSGTFEDAVKKTRNLLEDVKKVLWTIAKHDRVEELISAAETERIPPDKIFPYVKKKVEEEATDEFKGFYRGLGVE